MTRKLLSIAIVLAAVAGPAAAAELASSDTCGTCHRDIYRMWRKSAHADATEDPFFVETLAEVRGMDSGRREKICLGCHSPAAIASGDLELKLGASREGVPCDFCHSLVAVEMTDRGPRHKLDVGRVKRGTIAEADSPAHEVAYSELHESSLLCAPCHEYVSEDGVSILGTYSEWLSSRAAESGKTCQNCHMEITEAQVVDPKVVRKSEAKVNLHEMPGGHSVQQLLKALDIKVRTDRRGDALDVEITVSNEGAGHAVPTGMPGRRIILSVGVNAGRGVTHEEQRVYGKSFKDAKGKRIDHVGDYFGTSVLLESDTRIAPDEVRREAFQFQVPADVSAYLTVRLLYEHAPLGDDEEMERVTFFTDRKLVRSAKPG
jgi:hypothetical protein